MRNKNYNAANIQFETIRVEPNGKCKESMSFKNVDYCKIIAGDWDIVISTLLEQVNLLLFFSTETKAKKNTISTK